MFAIRSLLRFLVRPWRTEQAETVPRYRYDQILSRLRAAETRLADMRVRRARKELRIAEFKRERAGDED